MYRIIISPLYPPSCRFYPTCSQYAIQSIIKYGILIGSIKIVKRLIRCNPWNKGGFDPV